ncbi:hypothetical protein [Algibacter luteus]|uniref:hypothetical protein n=1 Tax=Algibacter luteus TaxID=1178825 RepID=UPI00259432AA|nr:hypothetical protein [Algibacter luteus]WJJ95304.1 hypothetical protein O5O44_08725 [Algibacter luteus]
MFYSGLKAIFMELKNLLEIIALVLVIIGWGITYWLAKKQDYHLELKKWEKELLDNQLSELYGKIHGILLENDRIRNVLIEQLGRKSIFRHNIPLSNEEEKLWLYYTENYFLPNNRKIVDLIKSNTHYLIGNEFPEIFKVYIDYAIGWELLHDQYLKIGREYDLHARENFPLGFQKRIIKDFSELKTRQWELVSENRISK